MTLRRTLVVILVVLGGWVAAAGQAYAQTCSGTCKRALVERCTNHTNFTYTCDLYQPADSNCISYGFPINPCACLDYIVSDCEVLNGGLDCVDSFLDDTRTCDSYSGLTPTGAGGGGAGAANLGLTFYYDTNECTLPRKLRFPEPGRLSTAPVREAPLTGPVRQPAPIMQLAMVMARLSTAPVIRGANGCRMPMGRSVLIVAPLIIGTDNAVVIDVGKRRRRVAIDPQ